MSESSPATAVAFQLHNATIDLAVHAQRMSTAKYRDAPNAIVRDALFVIAHDAVCVHRAVGNLAFAGWSSPASALLRTSLDITISTLAIVNSRKPSLAAFKYLYSNFRRLGRDLNLTPAHRKRIREQVRTRVSLLPPEQREEALRAYGEKDRAYWFAPEWPSPSAVMREFGAPGMEDFYRQFSAAAHGGFFGLRLFRDDPDRIDINAREPIGQQAVSVSYISAKLLVEVTRLRGESEQLDILPACSALSLKLNAVALGHIST